DVYLTERSRTAMHIPGAARPYRYSESNTYRTTLAALSAPGARHVPCDVSFANVCSWRPWLGMGDHPGHMMATGMGRQNATLASVPPEWREAAAQRRPELLSKPGALLDDLWNKR
ncbi:MAG TPA: DUF1838 family protein, partial [Novosphingobium sp.]|nr:DUF1838 family protein [Novosphingobium sp.]